MSRIFCYVVRHDTGFAPNPYGGYCTLATCKPEIHAHAQPGDWLLGTGSVRGPGNNRVIYAAHVAKVVPLDEYGSLPIYEVKRPGVSSAETWRRH